MLSRVYSLLDKIDCHCNPPSVGSNKNTQPSEYRRFQSAKSIPTPKGLAHKNTLNIPRPNSQGDLIKKLDNLEEIGHGSFGTVRRAKEPKSGQEFALKEIHNPQHKDAKREIAILLAMAEKKEPFPYVVGCIDALDSGKKMLICMPLIKGTCLFDEIIRQYPGMNEGMAKSIAKGIATGLHHLHKNGIVHRDLKPENIMLEADGTPQIIDFGLSATVKGSQDRMHTFCGTLGYIAPEVMFRGGNRESAYTMAADDWSLGVIIHAMLTTSLPFAQDNKYEHFQELKDYIRHNDSGKLISKFNALRTLNTKNVIKALLCSRAVNRLKTYNDKAVNEVIQHPWFKEPSVTQSQAAYSKGSLI